MRRLALGLALLAACGTAQAQAPVDAQLIVSEYGGAPVDCGGELVTDRWLIGKINATGTGNVRVDAYFDGHKFDRAGYRLTDAAGFVGAISWFPSPEELGEPYVWRFTLNSEGRVISDCSVTVTRI